MESADRQAQRIGHKTVEIEEGEHPESVHW
jgi:hypothetical protein